MSSPLAPLNFSAVALNVLQARTAAAPVAAADDAARQQRSSRQSDEAALAQLADTSAGPIPRGQLINILV